MKFIFPQNYNYNYKIFGLIDYKSGVFVLIWSGLIFLIINILLNKFSIKIFLFIILVFPIVIFSIVGVNGDNIIDTTIYVSKFILRQKIYFYSK